MTDTGESRAPKDADALRALAAALDGFLKGSAGVSRGVPGEGADNQLFALLSVVLEPLLRAGATAYDAVQATMRAATGDGQPRPQTPDESMQVLPVIAGAYLVSLARASRFWLELAGIYEWRESSALRSLVMSSGKSELSAKERRTAADELRELLRKIGDLSSQHARLYQRDLEEIATGMAAPEEPATDGEPKRFCRAKP